MSQRGCAGRAPLQPGCGTFSVAPKSLEKPFISSFIASFSRSLPAPMGSPWPALCTSTPGVCVHGWFQGLGRSVLAASFLLPAVLQAHIKPCCTEYHGDTSILRPCVITGEIPAHQGWRGGDLLLTPASHFPWSRRTHALLLEMTLPSQGCNLLCKKRHAVVASALRAAPRSCG